MGSQNPYRISLSITLRAPVIVEVDTVPLGIKLVSLPPAADIGALQKLSRGFIGLCCVAGVDHEFRSLPTPKAP